MNPTLRPDPTLVLACRLAPYVRPVDARRRAVAGGAVAQRPKRARWVEGTRSAYSGCLVIQPRMKGQ